MTFSAQNQTFSSFPSRHASEEEYAAFVLEHHGSLGSQNYYLQLRRAFVEAYPDLDAWFAAPLEERVGRVRRHPRSALIGRVSYRARPYLFFLALHGYLTFDWEWLIGISNIHLWEMLPSAHISSDIEQLIEEAVHLGYNRLSSSQDLRWVVSRIFLHTGKWQIDQITEAACDELAAAVRTFGDRSDIAFFHGSVEEYRRRARKSYLTAIHCLKVVLYHRGQAATEPWKVMPKYAEPSPGHPQMLAMISRYLTARRLTSRPATIVRLEVSFRRFMQWLSQAYPQIESWTEITRDHQRAALLIARWSGARRDEIRRLSVDCLDAYPDGTPRLRIPAGKTKRERMIPLHEEAAAAIREIQVLRCTEDRGLRDTQTGVETRYLFLHLGRLYSCYYLFERSLQSACEAVGLLNGKGKHTIHAHRFRHTVGTQLAERGAKLHTIMKILGHNSVSMSLVYAQISDREVLKDYQAVLGPGATLAGPFAETLKCGELPAA
ncbi:MAG TPA: tyrosine-type recombinase/integrase [Ktedonobacteraceae bacterium]|nr:tyrosine-type recombinase/integrase [Ktedonobacteraceae bacterium]